MTEARETFGHNELTKQPGKPMWKLVLEQFDDMLVKVRLPLSVQAARQCMTGACRSVLFQDAPAPCVFEVLLT